MREFSKILLNYNTQLTSLNLSGNSVPMSLVTEVLIGTTSFRSRLTVLNLASSPMGFEEIKIFQTSNISSITYLNLSGHVIGNRGAAVIAGLLADDCALNFLRTLDLSANGIKYEGAMYLINRLSGRKFFDYLNLAKNFIRKSMLILLTQKLIQNTVIAEFNLMGNTDDHSDIKVSDKIEDLTTEVSQSSLVSLNFSADVMRISSLTSLNLSFCELNDTTISKLYFLTLPSLLILNLSNNHLFDGEDISVSIQNFGIFVMASNQLNKISLRHNSLRAQIADALMNTLIKHPNLTYIDILESEFKIDDDFIAQIKQNYKIRQLLLSSRNENDESKLLQAKLSKSLSRNYYLTFSKKFVKNEEEIQKDNDQKRLLDEKHLDSLDHSI